MDRLQEAKDIIIKCCKNYGLLYNSIHIIDTLDINNYRVWCKYPEPQLSYEEAELFLGFESAAFWNFSSEDKKQYLKKINPFCAKKLPKQFV